MWYQVLMEPLGIEEEGGYMPARDQITTPPATSIYGTRMRDVPCDAPCGGCSCHNGAI